MTKENAYTGISTRVLRETGYMDDNATDHSCILVGENKAKAEYFYELTFKKAGRNVRYVVQYLAAIDCAVIFAPHRVVDTLDNESDHNANPSR